MKELHLSIVSPEKSVFDGEVKIVTLPGTVGSFSILPGHAPIVSSLKAGTLVILRWTTRSIHWIFRVVFVEMSDGAVSVCVSKRKRRDRLIRTAEKHNDMVNISKTKRNFIGLNTLFAILSGAAGALILHIALPGHYFGGYPFIPVYFYIFGLFSIYMFDACRRHAPQKMLLLYLAMKMIKMILSLILLLIYCLAVREEARAFLADIYLVLSAVSDI